MMNVHAQTLTPAEAALVQAYGEVAADLPGDAETSRAREAAIATIKAGLPTRRIEAWHYTDLRRLLSAVPQRKAGAAGHAIAPLIEGASVLALSGGVALGAEGVPAGVTLGSLSARLADGTFVEALAPAADHDAVGLVNAAFVADGYALDIAEGASVATPIELQNLHSGGHAHARFELKAGAGSKATIIERQTGTGEALISAISTAQLGEGAEIDWIIVQEQPDSATHLARFEANLAKDAKLKLFIVNTGGALVRQEVRVVAAGEGSDFQLRGVNLLAGKTHCDVTMVLDHAAEHTTSTETIRNVVTDRAHGVFQGQIRVAREAQKTDAKMACNTLLLSDDADFSAKPELEIFADDVACGHGATVTEIDSAHLFYLMARGIDEKRARGLLIKAFVAEIIEELSDEQLVAALEEKLDAWFAAHG
jgi:Fe-S cluster assembly protein SufD